MLLNSIFKHVVRDWFTSLTIHPTESCLQNIHYHYRHNHYHGHVRLSGMFVCCDSVDKTFTLV